MNKNLFATKDTEEDECKDEGCSCPASEEHPCPFAEEISDDSETLCTCCRECTHQCAMDI